MCDYLSLVPAPPLPPLLLTRRRQMPFAAPPSTAPPSATFFEELDLRLRSYRAPFVAAYHNARRDGPRKSSTVPRSRLR